MKQRIVRALTVAAIATAGAALTLVGTATASAAVPSAPAVATAQSHGPYSDLGTCNYLMYGVRAGGTPTTDCTFYRDETTCPGGDCNNPGTGWYFRTL